MKKRYIPLLALLVTSAEAATAWATCLHDDLPCASNENIAILGTADDQTDLLKDVVIAAGQSFEDQFGVSTPPSVIIPGGSIASDLSERLTENGYVVKMPWIRPQDRDALIETQIRKQVEAQMAGKPQAAIESMVKAALAQVQKPSSSAFDRTDLYALAHEMGHKWFIAGFAKRGEEQSGHAYGGWAPDWLDEAAAISLESDDSQKRRRALFVEMGQDRRVPLSDFLSMDHPLANAARELARQVDAREGKASGSTSRAIVLTGEEGKAFLENSGADKAADFYAQSLVFTDYLKARTGSHMILADLATALANDVTLDSWLQTQTGLPDDLSGLQQDWSAFADAVTA